jgi:hypothetical protein
MFGRAVDSLTRAPGDRGARLAAWSSLAAEVGPIMSRERSSMPSCPCHAGWSFLRAASAPGRRLVWGGTPNCSKPLAAHRATRKGRVSRSPAAGAPTAANPHARVALAGIAPGSAGSRPSPAPETLPDLSSLFPRRVTLPAGPTPAQGRGDREAGDPGRVSIRRSVPADTGYEL